MSCFHLKIVTAEGLIFDGNAEKVTVRTRSGDMTILPRHINCVAPLGMGRATVVANGKQQYAACIGGLLSVAGGAVALVPTTFEWAEDIDKMRAEVSRQRAEAILSDQNSSKSDIRLAQARLLRALTRLSVASCK